jgi:ABC-type multidrug transport system fused ATPase/permease subunit
MLKKLIFFLSPGELRHGTLLLVMIIINTILDTVGVASILPFIAVLANPSLIETNYFLNYMFQISKMFGVETNQEFFFTLGVIVFILLIASLGFKALITYVQLRFIYMCEYNIAKRMVEGYLHQPYSWFLSRNSADLGKNILSEVEAVVGGGMYQVLMLISKGILIVALIGLLVLVDPKLALIVGLSFCSAYFIIFYYVRKFIQNSGEKRLAINKLRFRTISEAFGAAKEVKVGGLENIYIKSFSDSAKIFAITNSFAQVVSQLPRFAIEAIAFGGILLIILQGIVESGSLNNYLPIIALYAFAGYRLMPALQEFYFAITQMTFVSAATNKLYNDIKNLKSYNKNLNQEILTFNKEISLKDIFYSYPNTSKSVLNGINITIPAKSRVGFVGSSGSGKTTTIDIILGLLIAQKGTLVIDGKVITEKNSRAWQRCIGYVPQHIYLSDDTVVANIAFGVEPKDINLEKVKQAAKIANIDNFIINELPQQYLTPIGERGVRLSGGQRQRVGIARALYHNPKVLILDEGTSALDNQTEEEVMNALYNVSKDITIILIAHRLNTIKKCDIIFKLENGNIIDNGTYHKLYDNKKV